MIDTLMPIAMLVGVILIFCLLWTLNMLRQELEHSETKIKLLYRRIEDVNNEMFLIKEERNEYLDKLSSMRDK
jgi:uncharacterized membrane protein